MFKVDFGRHRPGPLTLNLTVTPANPTILDTAALGDTVATLSVTLSNGGSTVGTTYAITSQPSNVWSISANLLKVNPAGPGVGALGGTFEDINLQATL